MRSLPLIAVDIGNSSTKLGWFEGGFASAAPSALPGPSFTVDYPTGQSPPAESVDRLPQSPARWRVASVQREGQRQLAEWVLTHRPQDDFRVLAYTDLPLEVRVDFPGRVGVDRLAAAVAAASAYRRTRLPATPRES